MKRVYCLYRVSTKKQVDRNDRDENEIPMQKKACHEFADRKEGWTILKEFSEKGVSGYKVSAKDRDAIQELKEAAQKKLDRELIKDRERLTKLQLEIGKTLTGESSYSADDLSQAIRTIKTRIGETVEKLEGLRAEEERERQGIDQITPAYDRFKSWAEEFDTATLEQQKMMACHLFKRIEVGRGYQIRAELNMTYRQFCSEWGGGDLLGEVIG